MKKLRIISLGLALLLSLSACGQTDTKPTEIASVEQTTVVAEESGVYTVSNVDEFLAAIGPDREIRVEAGTYNFSYAKPTENQYCYWQDAYDGQELVIQNVKNLTITGVGKNTVVFATEPRYAQVLRFHNCKNIFLSGFTAGHTTEPGACMGGVLYLDHCEGVSVRNVGLYGCGVTGVFAQNTSDLVVANSEIYDCSMNGVQLIDCTTASVTNCKIYNLGKGEWEASEVFSFYNGYNITVSDCEIYDNRSNTLVRTSGVDKVVFKNNSFRGNEVTNVAFGTFGNFVTLDNNQFEDCYIRHWFEVGCGAIDPEGNTISEDTMNGLSPEETVPYTEKTTVTVSNVDQFLDAIAPNTEIVLDGELFDFSTAKNYGGAPTKYYRWEDRYDGPGLVITRVNNLTIRSKDGKTKNHTLAAVPRYADVLYFENCKDIILSGFTAGHTQEPGECAGGVLRFDYCERISVDNCGMYGCGIFGVQASSCTEIKLRKCDIYECSYGGVQMSEVTGIFMDNCTFRDLGGNNLQLYGCSDVLIDGEYLNGQYYNGR